MIMSMTGFGRGEYRNNEREIMVQVRSVNHRYRDVSIKLQWKYSFAEEKIKNIVKNYISRGKIDIYIYIKELTPDNENIKLDLSLAKQYYKNLRELQKTFDVVGDITLDLLANMNDVMCIDGEVNNEDEIISDIIAASESALESFNSMRKLEGDKLAEDIIDREALIQEFLENIEQNASDVVKEYKERLHNRMTELLKGDIEFANERLALEAAIFAEKSNIDEEITRLKSHLSQLKKILSSNGNTNGKKIDFLIQEMNRETNTIGSKANSIDITNDVLNIKSEIEKIREQVQNIE